MARLPRINPPGIPQHVIQRGNNKNVCFAEEQDFSTYARWLNKYSKEHQVAIHAWVFMNNHVHLLMTPSNEHGISKLMQDLGRRYVRYFNDKYNRSGTLWEGRFRSSLVQTSHYLLNCYRYIELNPVRAGIVSEPADYAWSSYKNNGLGIESNLITEHDEYIQLGLNKIKRLQSYRELFDLVISEQMLCDIRGAVNKGFALGNDQFKNEIETLHGRRVTPARIGRPKISSI